MALDGSVVIGTELDEQGLKAGLDQLNNSVNNWGKVVIGSKAFSMITQGLIAVTKAGVSYNAQMEQYQTNFAVLLGDEAKALEYVAQMRETAAKTPFGMEDLASANQTLLSFGLSADEATEAVNMLGDISLGNSERFGSLALAFAQVSSAGKLTGQDLLQMINAGFNPLNTIAEKTGTNIGDLKEVMAGGKGSKEFQKQMKAAQSEVKKMGDKASEGAKMLAQIGKDGAISAEMVGLAMQAETSPGGRFYNGMEQASQTLGGMWSTLKDDTMQLAGNLFEPVTNGLKNVVLPAAQTVVSGLNSLFEEDTTVTISAEIQDAVDNIDNVEQDLADMRSNFASNVLKIRLEAENVDSLVGQYEAKLNELSGKKKIHWTEEDKAELAAIAEQIVAVYPDLTPQLNRDGYFKPDIDSLKELIALEKEHRLQRAAEEYLKKANERVAEAEISKAELEVQKESYEEQRAAAEQQLNDWNQLGTKASEAWGKFAFDQDGMPDDLNTESLQSYLGLVEQFIDLGGNFDELNLGENFNLANIIGDFGEVKSAEEIIASADALADLVDVLGEINNNSMQQEQKIQTDVLPQLDAQIQASSEGLAAAAKNIEEAYKYLELVEKTTNHILGKDGETGSEGEEGTPTDSMTAVGGEMATAAAQGVSDNSSVVETAVQTVVDESASSADTSGFNDIGAQIDAGVASGITSNTGVVTAAVKSMVKAALMAALLGFKIHSPSHLFEDEIGAMLPWGAAVGVEKNTWRLEDSIDNMVGRALPDVSGIASSIVQRPLSALSSMPMTAAGNGQMVNQTINFNVPVQTPDEFAQTMYLYNTYGLTEA